MAQSTRFQAIFNWCRGVGEQPTFAEQIETAQYEMQQKSKRELEESQLPLKIKRL